MSLNNTQLVDLPQPNQATKIFNSETFIEPKPSGSSNINVGNTERILSVAGGALLAYFAVKGLRRSPFSLGSIAATVASGMLLYRGASGYCMVNAAIGRDTAVQKPEAIHIVTSLTVYKPREEVYAFWRKLENLPRFMKHLKSVKEIDQKNSHWEARIPGGIGTLKWNAEIIEEEQNKRLVWGSAPGSVVDNAGEVVFSDAPGNRGTEIIVTISYRPPAGNIGTTVGKLLNPVFEDLIREDVRRFKQVMETGEIPTIEGQPFGRK